MSLYNATTPEELKSELLKMVEECSRELEAVNQQSCSDCGKEPCICSVACLGKE